MSRGGRRGNREEAEKQTEEKEREEARRLEDTQQEDILQMEETVPGKRQRTEERPAHLLSANPGTRKDI